MNFNLIQLDSLPFFDTHMHSVPHGGSRMSSFMTDDALSWIKICAAKGLSLICITEHVPLPEHIADPTADKDCALLRKHYIDDLLKKKELIKAHANEQGLGCLVGGEYDYFPGALDFYSALSAESNPEIKLLGVHFIDSIEVEPDRQGKDCYGERIAGRQEKAFCFDFSATVFEKAVAQKGINTILDRYFTIIEDAISSQEYDILAHLDLITKYNAEERFFVEDLQYRNRIQGILELVKEKDLALEINLGGCKATNSLSPKYWIIKQALSLGIPLTLGSDAHCADDLSIETFNWVVTQLKDIGIKEIAVPKVTAN